ncbi:MAG: hypothetical protein M3Z66_12265 [Chloroflexota bacterium]|nr:hypothetical protein [Chloroflexota bacterium]
MSFYLLAAVCCAIGIYWFITQIMPERRRVNLLRPSLADGFLAHLNEQRHAKGLPILELDEDLLVVAENKATHQFLTGVNEEGWEYPSQFARMFGHSILMETLLTAPATVMPEKLGRQRELFDGQWIRCGIGVAGGQSDQVVVAIVVCREAWEPAPAAVGPRSLLARLGLSE